MKKSVLTVVLCGLLFGGGSSFFSMPMAYAEPSKETRKKKTKSISAKQAANVAKGRYGGKVLKVSSSGDGYRVKLLTNDGKVISVFVDGVSGRIRG